MKALCCTSAILRFVVCLVILVGLGTGSTQGQPPPTKPALTAKQKERLKERDRLRKEAEDLYNQGKRAESTANMKKVLAIDLEVFGSPHEQVANSLGTLGFLYQVQENFGAARKARQQQVAVLTKLLGKDHWEVIDARQELQYVELLTTLNAAQRQELEKATQLNQKGKKLSQENKHPDAVKSFEEALAIRQRILGETHQKSAVTLLNLGDAYKAMGQYAKAEPPLRRACDIYRDRLGEKHPEYQISLDALARLYTAMGNWNRAEPLIRAGLSHRKEFYGEKHKHYATALNQLAGLYLDRGEYAKAEPLYRQARDIYKETLGEKHSWYISSLGNLGYLYERMGEYAKAEPLLVRSAELCKQVDGVKDPAYAVRLNNLGNLYSTIGAYAKAEACYRQSLDIRKEVLGEKHPAYATGLNGLASLYEKFGDAERAEPLFRQALEIRKQALGEKHPRYAESLSNLGAVYRNMGDYPRAEALFRQALELRKQVVGDKHRDYAMSLYRLGQLYVHMGDYARAEPLFRQALAIDQKALGEKHSSYAYRLEVLGNLYVRLNDYTRAESLLRQARDIRLKLFGKKHMDTANSARSLALLYEATDDQRAEHLFVEAVDTYKAALGDKHPNYATSLVELAGYYNAHGKFEQAGPLLDKALDIFRAAHGEGHPSYASTLTHLAVCEACRGNKDKGKALAREAMHKSRRIFEQTAGGLSESQQLAYSRQIRAAFNIFVTLTGLTATPAEEVYTEVLTWEAPVSVTQRAIRQARRALAPNEQSDRARLFAELEQATRLLAARSRANPDPKAPVPLRDELAELSNRIERVEQELAGASTEFRAALLQRRRTAEDIRRALPSNSVLVDFVEYTWTGPPTQGPKPDRSLYLAAFIVRKGRPVERIELGRLEPVSRAIDAWRKQLLGGERDNSGAEVRRLVWKPIEPFLKGVPTVLISPGGELARIPWVALPGAKEGTYFLEERAVSIVPIPQLVPELLSRQPAADVAPSLLLVGDVNFNGGAGAATVEAARGVPPVGRAGAPLVWPALPGTRAEVQAIKDSFRQQYPDGRLTELVGAGANSQAVRQQSPRNRFLHLATHGFFAPPRARSALAADSQAEAGSRFGQTDVTGFHPGLLSGLVLAGANRPADPSTDGGILTALEVETLDLSGVRLVTLSACETGLGESAGGEGLLGLERAFQVAGARTVVASLWQVSDRETQQLMALFYHNLWHKKLGPVEALRQAQLRLLSGSESSELGVRGLKSIDGPVPTGLRVRVSPKVWAAWVLSGDPGDISSVRPGVRGSDQGRSPRSAVAVDREPLWWVVGVVGLMLALRVGHDWFQRRRVNPVR